MGYAVAPPRTFSTATPTWYHLAILTRNYGVPMYPRHRDSSPRTSAHSL